MPTTLETKSPDLVACDLAICGIEADIGKEHADTFLRVQNPDLRADFVLANGSMSSNQSGEGDIRRALIETNLVDSMFALPGQLCYSTQIPVSLWILAKNKSGKSASARRSPQAEVRDSSQQILSIGARKFSTLIDREHTEADLEKIPPARQTSALNDHEILENQS